MNPAPGCGACKLLVRELPPSPRALLQWRWRSRGPPPTAQRPPPYRLTVVSVDIENGHVDMTPPHAAEEEEPEEEEPPPSASAAWLGLSKTSLS
ncbi:unnamed protein product [Heligmosomoides polygyrus]|uniref:Uncharacterized protein n=1 Tax=Heligmosomoides polygyrus TaxID=6339 RepID=A0A183FVA9_HELPZ|nr:unnamed protein product [Heligmosomoides polygyrus]